jgi:hypothetical protein
MLTLYKNKQIEIPNDDPFKNDVLNRSKEIKNLTLIIDSIKQPFVLSINGQWGSGKTTFIRLWQQYIENEGFISLYFNSWENDSSKEPLISLIGEIQEQIAKKYNERSLSTILNSLKKTSGKLLAKAIPTAIKIGTYGLLDIKSDSNIEDTLADFLSQLPSDYIKYKGEREKFKSTLSKFADKLIKNQNLLADKKIVFFIDELDRCRPTFAIELLESVKHFFNIEKYVFILAMDKDQLGYSLQTLYGNNMDTEGYLRRFIDFNYNVSTPQLGDFFNLLNENLGLIGVFERKYLDSSRPKFFMDMLKGYCIGFKLSLRDIEQLFFQLKIIIPQINFEILYNLYTIPLLLVVRLKHPKMYHDFIDRKADDKEIVNLIKTNKGIQEFFDYHSIEFLNIKVPEYLKIISVSSINESNLLSRFYLDNMNKNPDMYPSNIYSGLDQIAKIALSNKALEKIKEMIEFSSKIY